MNTMFTLKKSFIGFLVVLVFLALLTFSALQNLSRSIQRLQDIEDKREHATTLATEFQNYNQYLTRDAMAFVATEQPEFEESHAGYLAVLQGQAIDSDGRAEPMLHKFEAAALTRDELNTVRSAYDKTLELAKIQLTAMNTAKGLVDDGKGGLKVALPDPLLAKVMLFSQQYTQAAADVARDIDDFNIMQTNRFTTQIEEAGADSQRAQYVALSALTLLLLCSAIALFALYRSIKRPLDQGVELARRLAHGDLTARTDVVRQDEMGHLLSALNGIGSGLTQTVYAVRERTVQIAAASRQISGGNMDLAQHAREQAGQLQETAAAMEQLAVTVRHNTDSAGYANTLSSQASDCAVRGSDEVQKVIDSMQDIRQSSGKMADIVRVINGIAFQTNILALNAAVEAARAGQHGRGFAVVASEVQSLAQRSATSAKEIEQLIRHSVEQIDAGARGVDSASNAMREIVTSVEKVRGIMKSIASASAEQSSGIDQVTQAVGTLDTITQQNARLVQEAANATLAQQKQVEALEETVERFTLSAA